MSHSHLLDLLEASRALGDERPAIVSADGELGYGALWHRVDETAALLARSGVGAGDHVGLHFLRSADYVTSLLATLTVGAVGVPLDPEYPAERIDQIIEAADPRVILRNGASRHGDELLRPDRWVDVGGPDGAATGPGTASTSRPAGATAQDPALILFTSGSTGKPKGVVLQHPGSGRRRRSGLRQGRAARATSRLSHPPLMGYGSGEGVTGDRLAAVTDRRRSPRSRTADMVHSWPVRGRIAPTRRRHPFGADARAAAPSSSSAGHHAD
ncbi:AMP-binding protein [Streptomyces sp. NPDC006324]|uniref:AMP-binding protein n=1 Tax=Streptomyces sp. NPDC006324 TaxID=3156751 RepID=UPI0033A52351